MDTELLSANVHALLQWIEILPPEIPENDYEDLHNGIRLWDILRQLDPKFFTGELPRTKDGSSRLILRSENLKHVVKSLERYVSSRGYSLPNQLEVDTQSAASNEDPQGPEMVKLFKMVLYAALKSPQIEQYVSFILRLETDAQLSLMDIIKVLDSPTAFQTDPQSSHTHQEKNSVTDYPEMDPALRYEEKLSELTAERNRLLRDKQDLQRELREFDNRHSRLQENNDILQQELADAQDRLRQTQYRGSEETQIRRLDTQVQQQDDIIAGLEAQLSEHQENSDNFNKEIGRLRRENDRIQPLQDELDETKAQRDQLVKKANAAEKYKQKLQESADLEKENQLLRGEVEELRYEKGDGSNARSEIAGLQRTLDEYKNLLPSIERERHELQMMLKQYERDNADLEQEVETVKDQLGKAQEQITDLQAGRAPSPLDDAGRGLASEMEDSERREALEALSPEEKINRLLKDVDELRAELFMRKQRSEDQDVKYAELEKRFEELHTEKLALQKGLTKSEVSSEESIIPSLGGQIGDAGSISTTLDAQIAFKESENAKLKERIKLMETKDPASRKLADAALLKQELVVLRQENKLISTAWYDLNGRTHLNNVILQRKSEPPKGMLKAAREFAERSMAIRGR